ncbi:MAG: NAD(P)H-hydrate epimerase, partial [Acidimicrobiia bacterium]
MKPVLSAEAAAELDQDAPAPVEALMERAGLAVALEAVRMGARYGDRVVVLAGPGNNGGDGYVAARYLRERGVAVEVRSLAEPSSSGATWGAAGAREAGVPIREWSKPGDTELVIDALFGGGFRHGLPSGVEPWMTAGLPVLAVEVPTGLDPSTGMVEEQAFTAAATVTFHAYKVGHVLGEGPERCGRVTVADIGLVGGRPELLLVEDGDAPRPVRART